MTFCCGLENDLMVAYADHSICIVKSDTGFAAAKLTSHRARVYLPLPTLPTLQSPLISSPSLLPRTMQVVLLSLGRCAHSFSRY